MTFIEVMNNEEGRYLVEAIEDTVSSLQAYPEGDRILESMLRRQVEELRNRFGYEYDTSF